MDEFHKELQKLTSKEDFEANAFRLNGMPIEKEPILLSCLKLGATIRNAIDAMEIIYETSRKSGFTPRDIIAMYPIYLKLQGRIEKQIIK